jgi:ABC-type nitrate/sulfonate/bicarbonate transport system substrate-binding protein
MSGAFSMYFVAQDRGYFADEGLDVEIIRAAGPPATAALISGDTQFNGSPGAAIGAILKGAPLKLVLVSNDRPSYQLWSGDPKIHTVADLKGGRVGVISHGDTHEFAVRLLLISQGVNPGSVSFAPMGPGGGRLAGISSGALPAASLTMDEVEQVREDPKNLHMVADTSRLVHMIVGGMATSDKMLTADREQTKKFMRALVKGRRYASAFPEPTVDSLQKRNPSVDRDALQRGYRVSQDGQTEDGTVPVEVQKSEIEIRAQLMKVPEADVPSPDKVFDFSVLNEVNRELDSSGWKPVR